MLTVISPPRQPPPPTGEEKENETTKKESHEPQTLGSAFKTDTGGRRYSRLLQQAAVKNACQNTAENELNRYHPNSKQRSGTYRAGLKTKLELGGIAQLTI